ncbi:serine O-acetyltransferase [Bradyrhizobium sp. SSUT18]|uniref:serine O-acetyltransferase EpsC n=1 Tax=Bradyrhizobium sp. SSUT18 TaxID=3040602 RepID=UPI00244ABF67|nr:serine O-acetyltransferase EpsC [Bradyrhizobium sp. SSUT18]MDH2399898.1 serine O-acetyltransferase [Bradyrhizobium sp. SSUT18]
MYHRLRTVDENSATIHAIWRSLQSEATELARTEHALSVLVDKYVCAHARFEDALTACIVGSLADPPLPPTFLSTTIAHIVEHDDDIAMAAALDLAAIVERDPAADGVLRPFLFYPGFRALQIYRAAHHLWVHGKRDMALLFQSIASRRFSIDIHPAASIGTGIFIDHGFGVVIGETAVLENNISMLHEVTIGGTGKRAGRRHAHIREGVLLAAGATILGDIEVGAAAKVGAGSLVINSVAARSTVVGVPSIVVGSTSGDVPAFAMDQRLPS